MRVDPSVRRLAGGILTRALRDVAVKRTGDTRWETWHRDALEWVFSDNRQPASFYWVCDMLQISPPKLRGWVHTYMQSNKLRKTEMANRLPGIHYRC